LVGSRTRGRREGDKGDKGEKGLERDKEEWTQWRGNSGVTAIDWREPTLYIAFTNGTAQ
jgi:hypothetical protein